MPAVELFLAAELEVGEIRRVELAGRTDIAVYNLDGEWFATDDLCTHGEASLADGEVDGDEIVCPFHLGRFNIRSGEASMSPCAVALKTYLVRIERGIVCVDIDG